MEGIEEAEELIKEYLIFRGFTVTLRSFEQDKKHDVNKDFQVTHIIEHLFGFIHTFNLTSLQQFWAYLDRKFFSLANSSCIHSVHKLEVCLYRYYTCMAIQANKKEKVTELFERLGPEMMQSSSWKEWFSILFIASPEHNAIFQPFFTKQWAETFTLSLYNLLSTVIDQIPLPGLLKLTKDKKIQSSSSTTELTSEKIKSASSFSSFSSLIESESSSRGSLKDRIMGIGSKSTSETPGSGKKKVDTKSIPPKHKASNPVPTPQSEYRIEQKNNNEQKNPSRVERSRRNRRSSIPSASPIPAEIPEKTSRRKKKRNIPKSKIENDRSSSEEDEEEDEDDEERSEPYSLYTSGRPPLEIVHQEVYKEHRNGITHCKFAADSSTLASVDESGLVKIWNVDSKLKTEMTINFQPGIQALEWDPKHDNRRLLLGTKTGAIQFYDTEQKCNIFHLETNAHYSKIMDMGFNLQGTAFVTSNASPSGQGLLNLWDLRTSNIDRAIVDRENPSVIYNTFSFNHNGSMLVVGGVDGVIRLFGLHNTEKIMKWKAHDTAVACVRFSVTESSVFSLTESGWLVEWSMHQCGEELSRTNCISTGLKSRTASSLFSPPSYLLDANSSPVHAVPYKPERYAGGSLCLDAEGEFMLVSSADLSGLVCQTDTLTPILLLDGHTQSITCADWSDISNVCVTGSKDSTLRVHRLIKSESA